MSQLSYYHSRTPFTGVANGRVTISNGEGKSYGVRPADGRWFVRDDSNRKARPTERPVLATFDQRSDAIAWAENALR